MSTSMPRFLRRRIRKAYFAGPETSDAMDACHRFAASGMSATAGYWPSGKDTPESVAAAYLAAIDAIAGTHMDCTVSVKVMELDFDPGLVDAMVERAAASNVGIHYDSRAPELADQVFEAVKRSAGHELAVGCTLPGRWKRSLDDTELAIELAANVRVVKGQWGDPDNPDIDLRGGFLDVIDRLAGRARHVGVATHDPWLADQALRRLADAGTPCELEQLFGLPMRETLAVAEKHQTSVRMYIPYGSSWVPYASAWALKNPRVLWWVARDVLFGKRAQRLK